MGQDSQRRGAELEQDSRQEMMRVEQQSRQEMVRAIAPALAEAVRTGRCLVAGCQAPAQSPAGTTVKPAVALQPGSALPLALAPAASSEAAPPRVSGRVAMDTAQTLAIGSGGSGGVARCCPSSSISSFLSG